MAMDASHCEVINNKPNSLTNFQDENFNICGLNKLSHKPFLLMIGDNISINRSINSSLTNKFNIVYESNAFSAISLAIKLLPDLILIEINKNNNELIKNIRSTPELNDIPIIVICKSDEKLKIQFLKEGAQDYIIKPFNKDELLIKITNYLTLKKAKDIIKAKTQELAQLNDELDAYQTSISQGILNSVNNIINYSNLLLTHATPTALELNYLTEVDHNAKMMAQNINALRLYSYCAKSVLKHEKFNLSQIVVKIMHDYSKDYRLKSIIKKDVCIVGDKNLITIAFEELIKNAIKFSSKKKIPLIEFGVLEDSPRVYFLRDNGVGFKTTNVQKLFVPFTREQQQIELDGLGIGLAIVKCIIERHHGKIWTDSKINEGTTIYITFNN